MRKLVLAAILLTPTIALADIPANQTLLIESESGQVIQLPGLTQRECDGLAGMMAQRKPGVVGQSTNYILNSTSAIGVTALSCFNCGTTTLPAPTSSKLTSAKCMVPAN